MEPAGLTLLRVQFSLAALAANRNVSARIEVHPRANRTCDGHRCREGTECHEKGERTLPGPGIRLMPYRWGPGIAFERNEKMKYKFSENNTQINSIEDLFLDATGFPFGRFCVVRCPQGL